MKSSFRAVVALNYTDQYVSLFNRHSRIRHIVEHLTTSQQNGYTSHEMTVIVLILGFFKININFTGAKSI